MISSAALDTQKKKFRESVQPLNSQKNRHNYWFLQMICPSSKLIRTWFICFEILKVTDQKSVMDFPLLSQISICKSVQLILLTCRSGQQEMTLSRPPFSPDDILPQHQKGSGLTAKVLQGGFGSGLWRKTCTLSLLSCLLTVPGDREVKHSHMLGVGTTLSFLWGFYSRNRFLYIIILIHFKH